MILIHQIVFALIWIGSILGMLLGLSGSDPSGGPGLFPGSFLAFIAATVVLLLCEIARSLERLAPKPKPPEVKHVSPTL